MNVKNGHENHATHLNVIYICEVSNGIYTLFIFVKNEHDFFAFLSTYCNSTLINRQILKLSNFSPTYLVFLLNADILYANARWQLVTENAIKQTFVYIFRFWPALYLTFDFLKFDLRNMLKS